MSLVVFSLAILYSILTVINVTVISFNTEFGSKMEYEKKKKTEGKMVRAERQLVLDMLFSAFEKHQYYNIKALVDITKQPVVSSVHAHKPMWNRQHVHTLKHAHMQQHHCKKHKKTQYTCPLSTLLC